MKKYLFLVVFLPVFGYSQGVATTKELEDNTVTIGMQSAYIKGTNTVNGAVKLKRIRVDSLTALAKKGVAELIVNKAELSYVNTQLAGKTSTAQVNTIVSPKIDSVRAKALLALKADLSALNSKVETSTFNSALSNKSNTSDLALKANTADVNALLNFKLNNTVFADTTTALRNIVNTKASITYTNQRLYNATSKTLLTAFTDADIANYDGSIWEKKIGNVASNGGSYAGTIINVSSSVYWERKFNNNVDVKWFGAVADGNYTTGTGTDNSASIQNAVNYAYANNLGVIVSRGIYKCVTGIQIPSGLNFQGDGIWNSILFAPTTFTDINGLLNVNGIGGYPSNISNLAVLCQSGGCLGTGINCTKNGTFISNIWVAGFTIGIDLISTDIFLSNFAVEYCVTGIVPRASSINIINGTVYNCSIGLTVANNSFGESSNILLTDVRINESTQNAFVLGNYCKNIVVTNCHAYATNISGLQSTGFYIEGSDIKISKCTSKFNTGTATTAIALSVNNSSNIEIEGFTGNNFKIGAKVNNSYNVKVLGSNFNLNNQYGIHVTGGDIIDISGNTCLRNGTSGATSDAAIKDENTDAYAIHKVSNNICVQNGGGNQDYGLDLSVTDNSGSSGATYINGNVANFNNIGQIQKNGLVANIINN